MRKQQNGDFLEPERAMASGGAIKDQPFFEVRISNRVSSEELAALRKVPGVGKVRLIQDFFLDFKESNFGAVQRGIVRGPSGKSDVVCVFPAHNDTEAGRHLARAWPSFQESCYVLERDLPPFGRTWRNSKSRELTFASFGAHITRFGRSGEAVATATSRTPEGSQFLSSRSVSSVVMFLEAFAYDWMRERTWRNFEAILACKQHLSSLGSEPAPFICGAFASLQHTITGPDGGKMHLDKDLDDGCNIGWSRVADGSGNLDPVPNCVFELFFRKVWRPKSSTWRCDDFFKVAIPLTSFQPFLFTSSLAIHRVVPFPGRRDVFKLRRNEVRYS